MSRQPHQRRRWGQTQEDRERAAKRAREEARHAAEAFLLGADEYTFALIERFGIPAVRRQLAENEEAYRKERQQVERMHTRRTFADALKLAKGRFSPANTSAAPSFRIVLYLDADAERRVRAERELAALGVLADYERNGDG